jgi:3D (Asp-Asp-Asp) domain-containing protein
VPPEPLSPTRHPGNAFARNWAALNQRSAVPAIPAWNLHTGFARSAGALSRRLALSGLAAGRVGSAIIVACAVLGMVMLMLAADGTWGFPLGWTIHVSADGHTRTFRSYRRSVGALLAAHRIVLHSGDVVTPSPTTVIWPGMRIAVVRAVPAILIVGGVARRVRAAATTVAGALRATGVSVHPLDRVYPSPSTPLAPDMTIRVVRREWRSWVQRKEIPFTSMAVADASLYKWHSVLRSPGRDGVEVRTVRALYADGRPTVVRPLAWTVVEKPTPRVTAIGTRAMVASRGAFIGREYLVMQATAYYPGPDNYGGGVGPRTAIGMVAQRGVVAVDPSVIPLGTRLYIEGYGYAVAGDTGGAIHGLRIDLCYNSFDEAMRFGRRPVTVYILAKR